MVDAILEGVGVARRRLLRIMLISQNGSVGGSYSNISINSSGTDTNSKGRILSAPFQPSSDSIACTDSSITPQISREIEVSYHNFRFQPLEKVSQLKFDKVRVVELYRQ